VTVKMKLSDFRVLTRGQTPRKPVSTFSEIWEVAHDIFQRELPCELRLLGVRVSNFLGGKGSTQTDDPHQAKLARFFSSKPRADQESLAEEAASGHKPEQSEEDFSAWMVSGEQADAERRLASVYAEGIRASTKDRDAWWEVPCITLDEVSEDEREKEREARPIASAMPEVMAPRTDADASLLVARPVVAPCAGTLGSATEGRRRRSGAAGGAAMKRGRISDWLRPAKADERPASSSTASATPSFGQPVVVDLC